MKNTATRIIAFGIILSLFICPAKASGAFPDVADTADYAEAVSVLNNMGIMVGDEQGNFNPNKTVTRAEMAAIICRMIGETENFGTDGTQFSDVLSTHWANSFIIKASSLGIIGGYEDGTFRPDETVTYAQALTMVVRAMGLEDRALEAGGYPDGYIKIANENGLAGGFAATQGELLMRWQVAKIIFGVFM